MSTQTVDCAGLNCPLPILRLSKAINGIAVGDSLELIATDPGSVKDVQAWTKQTGHKLINSSESSGKYVFLIEKLH